MLYLDKIIVKFLSNAMSKGIFLSRDIVAIGNMRASKLHCSAILTKNIARVNQPLKLNKIAHFVQRVICSVHSASVYSGKVRKKHVFTNNFVNFKATKMADPILESS